MEESKPRTLVQPFDPAVHRRDQFFCGVDELDDFLKTKARKQASQNLSKTFVLVAENDLAEIIGYYTALQKSADRSP